MSESEWKKLFYTTDWEGNHMRLDGHRGKLFTASALDKDFFENRLYDVKLPDGTLISKCLLDSIDCGRTARAITEDGRIIELVHLTHIRPNPDKKLQKKIEDIRHKWIIAESRKRKNE